jgi:hypothetical protein
LVLQKTLGLRGRARYTSNSFTDIDRQQLRFIVQQCACLMQQLELLLD